MFFLFFFFNLYFFFFSCASKILVPWLEIEPPALGVHLNHWTTMEVKDLETILDYWGGPLALMTSVPLRDAQHTGRMKAMWRWEQRLHWCGHKPRTVGATRSWRGKEDFSPKAFRGNAVLETLSGLPASKNIKDYISVVLSRWVCSNALQQLWEMIQ